MTRTVTALFDSRPEAEAARARLASQVEVQSFRMLAKDTAAAVEDLKLDPDQAKAYREALLNGEHLLVAKVTRGEDAKRIIDALAPSRGVDAPAVDALQSAEVEGSHGSQGDVAEPDATLPAPAAPDSGDRGTTNGSKPAGPSTAAALPRDLAPKDLEASEAREELRIGEPEVVRRADTSGAATRDVATDQLPIERGGVEPADEGPGRRLTYAEVEARGLLKERVIEVVEMREEPVVAKEVVVREEVIVRKVVTERTETVRDTLRETEVEVDELPSSGNSAR